MIIFYILRQIAFCLHHKKPISSSDFGKGVILYRNTKAKGKKSIFRVFMDLRHLSSYWHAYPDSYFRFGMFMKSFGDMKLMKSFIPQDAYYKYAADTDSRYHVLIDDKILFHKIMMMYQLPVPERYFVYQDGKFERDGVLIDDREVDNIINGITDKQIFIKKYTGGAASGVSIAILREDGYYVRSGSKLSAENIRALFSDSNYIFERQIIQHDVLNSFNPDSVNTIRVLTYKNKSISASVRFGRKGDYCDNVSKGGIAVSVDLQTGELGEFGMRMYDVEKYFEHPDSHIPFAGAVIPGWSNVLEVVEKAIQVLPYYNSVGFDIAISDNGPVIVEINNGAGVGLSQTGKLRGIADCFVN